MSEDCGPLIVPPWLYDRAVAEGVIHPDNPHYARVPSVLLSPAEALSHLVKPEVPRKRPEDIKAGCLGCAHAVCDECDPKRGVR